MAYFDTHATKIDKIDAPLMIIGLGGTGADGLLRVKATFAERFKPEKTPSGAELEHPPRTAYLAIDTDATTLAKKYHGVKINKDTEWFDLSCDINHVLGGNGRNLEPHIKEWLDRKFYTDQELIRSAATDGAGTYRQLSRMMLFRKSSPLLSKLTAMLTQLATTTQGNEPGRRTINVVVITGLSGGTGSGTFLDIAYLIRHAAASHFFDVKLDLYAVAPDVTIHHHAASDSAKQKIYKTNSFAAFKELDYWMGFDDRIDPKLHVEDYMVNYGPVTVHWNSIPYDDVSLLCATNDQGALLQNAYNVVLNSMAEVLLFQMAGESEKDTSNINDNSQDSDTFSFQSQRSNEHAYRQALPKPYPEHYCYRTIGAYSNLGEARTKITMETELIFNDYQSFVKDPVRLPVMEGSEPTDVQEVLVEKLNSLYGDFQYANPIPADMFSKQSPWAVNEVKAMDTTQAPHGMFVGWKKDVLEQVPLQKKKINDEFQETFYDWARNYIMQRGPQALQRMLSDPDHGLIRFLQGKVESYKAQARNYHSEYTMASGAAESSFMKLTSLGNSFVEKMTEKLGITREVRDQFDNYISIAQEMYEAFQNEQIMTILADVITDFVPDIRTNIVERTLPWAINAVAEIQQSIAEDAASTTTSTEFSVVNRAEMQNRIQAIYKQDARNIQFREKMLESVANVVLSPRNIKNEDDAANYVIAQMDALVNTTFEEVNNMSMVSMLEGFNDVNENGVDRYVQEVICPRLRRGASPHFALSPAYGHLTSDNASISTYVSVPQGYDQIRSGVLAYIQNDGHYAGGTVKSSAIQDRIFWMNVVAGLPLCAYAYLKEYEGVYLEQIQTRPGEHLVMRNEDALQQTGEERTASNDWSYLPSPCPYGMLGKDNPDVIGRWEAETKLLAECRDAGILSVETPDAPLPADVRKYDMHLHMFDEDLQQDDVKRKMQEALAALVTPEEKMEAISSLEGQLLHSYRVMKDADTAMQMTEKVSEALGVGEIYSKSEQTRRKCYTEVGHYMLNKRPLLMGEMKRQLSLKQPLIQEMQHLKEVVEGENRTMDSMEKVAQLLVFGRIRIQMMNVVYLNELDELETAGEKNYLMRQADKPYKETWGNFIPAEVQLAIWYAQQNRELEPFYSLEAKADSLMEAVNAMEGTPEDIELLKKYVETGEALLKVMPQRRATIKSKQQSIPKDVYALAMKTIDSLEMNIEGMITPWKYNI